MSLKQYGVAMDDDEIAHCLESMGVGTLAFGDERGGYAIPMSFGYDSVNDRCVFQFSFGEDSRKAAYIEQDNRVSLSVHEWNSVTDWRSVVVHGTLEPVSADRTAVTAGIYAAHAKIASLEVFRRPFEDLKFEWYELQIDEKQGRQSGQ